MFNIREYIDHYLIEVDQDELLTVGYKDIQEVIENLKEASALVDKPLAQSYMTYDNMTMRYHIRIDKEIKKL